MLCGYAMKQPDTQSLLTVLVLVIVFLRYTLPRQGNYLTYVNASRV